MAPSREEVEERKHFLRIVQAYKNYSSDSKERLRRTWDSYKRIPSKHKALLKINGYEDDLKKIDDCIDANGKIVNEFIGKDQPFALDKMPNS